MNANNINWDYPKENPKLVYFVANMIRRFTVGIDPDVVHSYVHSAIAKAAGQYDKEQRSEKLITFAVNRGRQLAINDMTKDKVIDRSWFKRHVDMRTESKETMFKNVHDSHNDFSHIDNQDIVQRMIKLLPSKLKVVAMGIMQGKTRQQIAMENGTTKQTIQVRFDKMKQILKREFVGAMA